MSFNTLCSACCVDLDYEPYGSPVKGICENGKDHNKGTVWAVRKISGTSARYHGAFVRHYATDRIYQMPKVPSKPRQFYTTAFSYIGGKYNYMSTVFELAEGQKIDAEFLPKLRISLAGISVVPAKPDEIMITSWKELE